LTASLHRRFFESHLLRAYFLRFVQIARFGTWEGMKFVNGRSGNPEGVVTKYKLLLITIIRGYFLRGVKSAKRWNQCIMPCMRMLDAYSSAEDATRKLEA